MGGGIGTLISQLRIEAGKVESIRQPELRASGTGRLHMSNSIYDDAEESIKPYFHRDHTLIDK